MYSGKYERNCENGRLREAGCVVGGILNPYICEDVAVLIQKS